MLDQIVAEHNQVDNPHNSTDHSAIELNQQDKSDKFRCGSRCYIDQKCIADIDWTQNWG